MAATHIHMKSDVRVNDAQPTTDHTNMKERFAHVEKCESTTT